MWKIFCSSHIHKCFSSVILIPISMANEPIDLVLLIPIFVTSQIAYHKTSKNEATWCQKPPYITWAVKQHRFPWACPLTHPVPVFNCLKVPVPGLCTDLQSPLLKHHHLCETVSTLSFSFFLFPRPSASSEKSVL